MQLLPAPTRTPPSGYLWLFPKREHISAGLGQMCGDGKAMKQTFLAYLRGQGLPAEGSLRGAVVPRKAATDRIVGERLLLAGDAGGFVDAFTGEGIHFAMLSGMLAGQTLAAAASRGDFSAGFLDGYRRRCRDEFLLELLAAVRITNAMYRFPNLLLRTAVRHEEAKPLWNRWSIGPYAPSRSPSKRRPQAAIP